MSAAPARCGEGGRIASHIWLAHEGESYSVCRLCGAVLNSATPASGPRVDLPTLHAIGLAPQLAELERICAEAYNGKHAGETILQWGEGYHWNKAISHLNRGEFGARDNDSGARHLIHAAARLLMAAACLDAEEG